MHENTEFSLSREVEAIEIPSGRKLTLAKGTQGVITQALGGSTRSRRRTDCPVSRKKIWTRSVSINRSRQQRKRPPRKQTGQFRKTMFGTSSSNASTQKFR